MPERDGDGAIEEIAIMADDQDGAIIIGNDFLQQIQRLQIEIVGWLVQHQQVGMAGKFARKQEPRAFAARERADRVHPPC
jgi:hypothetical protein